MDPKDLVPFPSQKQGFGLPVVIHKHPDKVHLRETIRLMRQQGMCYREIGNQLDVDSSRVLQLFKTIDKSKLRYFLLHNFNDQLAL